MFVNIKREYSKNNRKNDKTCDTIPVKLQQKPCHIKYFLNTLIGAVHN